MEIFTAELVVPGPDQLGEGPSWDPETGRLIWVDILGAALREYDPGSGAVTTIPLPGHPGFAVRRRAGGFVIGLPDGIWARHLDGRMERLAEVEPDRPGNRLNDGKCDPRGRLWAGTMAYDGSPGAGSLYRLDPDHTLHRIMTGASISNGMAWSGDGRTMYYIDTPTGSVDAFDYDPETGAIANRRQVAKLSPERGWPDGMTIDREDCLWVACWEGWRVCRYRPDGELLAEVEVPAACVTSCAFGGADLRDLYITTASHEQSRTEPRSQPRAGGLFRVRPGVQGRPEPGYAG